jgi:hypothetical protein
MWTDVSEERINPIFKVENQPSQEDGVDAFLLNVASLKDYTALYFQKFYRLLY